jgi:outer membrane immunogenic protein
MLRKLFLAGIVVPGLIAAGSPVGAADVEVSRPYPTVLPVFNWTGLYVGGHLGGVDNKYDVNFTAVPNVSTFNTINLTNFGRDPNRATSFIGGGQIGYNLQFGQFVLGVEGDYSGMHSRQTLINAGTSGAITTTGVTTTTVTNAGTTGTGTTVGTATTGGTVSGTGTTASNTATGGTLSSTGAVTGSTATGATLSSTNITTGSGVTGGTLTTTLDIKSNWAASVRARAGVTWGSWLFYATGGLAFTDINLNSGTLVSISTGPIGTDANSSKSYTGFTVGVGSEYAFSEFVSFGVEYRYSDYGRESFTSAIADLRPTVPDTFFNTTTSVKLTSQQITGRVNIRFGSLFGGF